MCVLWRRGESPREHVFGPGLPSEHGVCGPGLPSEHDVFGPVPPPEHVFGSAAPLEHVFGRVPPPEHVFGLGRAANTGARRLVLVVAARRRVRPGDR